MRHATSQPEITGGGACHSDAIDDECEVAIDAASTTSAGTSSGSASSFPSGEEAESGLSCLLCCGLRGDLEEPLFRSPCRCPDAFVHRSCVEEQLFRWADGADACPACGARYPLRRRTKPLWRWFWDQESRDDATLFAVNLVFSAGNVGVLSMAWMYVLFEYRSSTWLPTSWLASALFVFSVFWVGFGCFRFYVVYSSYARWRRANTTVNVLLADKGAAQA
ncbi:hypothetical protein V5799_005054 [Amblyomma americanum]|uniref:RING-CH-type domain-containing protein n=1 Tax=Amblyomma americanum TaxID=6943 RepID=A0AAQ4D4D0_AMBAM